MTTVSQDYMVEDNRLKCMRTVESAPVLLRVQVHCREAGKHHQDNTVKEEERLSTHDLPTHNAHQEAVNSLFRPFNVADYTPGTNNLGQLSCHSISIYDIYIQIEVTQTNQQKN